MYRRAAMSLRAVDLAEWLVGGRGEWCAAMDASYAAAARVAAPGEPAGTPISLGACGLTTLHPTGRVPCDWWQHDRRGGWCEWCRIHAERSPGAMVGRMERWRLRTRQVWQLGTQLGWPRQQRWCSGATAGDDRWRKAERKRVAGATAGGDDESRLRLAAPPRIDVGGRSPTPLARCARGGRAECCRSGGSSGSVCGCRGPRDAVLGVDPGEKVCVWQGEGGVCELHGGSGWRWEVVGPLRRSGRRAYSKSYPVSPLL